MAYLTIFIFFIFAVMSGLGIGGGGLMVIYLALFTNVGQLTAQGINLVFFLFSSGASILVHLSKRKILTGAVVIMSVSGISGAIAGSLISGMIDQGMLRKIFGIMLIICGMISFRSFSTKSDSINNEIIHSKNEFVKKL